jgi:hypothetical protein
MNMNPTNSQTVSEIPTSQMARDKMEDFAYYLWQCMDASLDAGDTDAARIQEVGCDRLFTLVAAYDAEYGT